MDLKIILKKKTAKVGEYTPYGYSMSAISAFDGMKNKHGLCRGEDCLKKNVRIFKTVCNESNLFWEGNDTIKKQRS